MHYVHVSIAQYIQTPSGNKVLATELDYLLVTVISTSYVHVLYTLDRYLLHYMYVYLYAQ